MISRFKAYLQTSDHHIKGSARPYTCISKLNYKRINIFECQHSQHNMKNHESTETSHRNKPSRDTNGFHEFTGLDSNN